MTKKIRAKNGPREKLDEQEYFFEIVKFFISSGILPWWGDVDGIDIEEIFFRFIQERPAEAEVFLRKMNENSILRIIRQFGDPVHSGLLKVIYNSESPEIVSLIGDFKKLLSESKLLHPLKSGAEEMILFIMLKDAENIKSAENITGKVFNQFLRKSLAEQNISLPEMITQFSEAVNSLKNKQEVFNSDLPDVIAGLENQLKSIEKDLEYVKDARESSANEKAKSRTGKQRYDIPSEVDIDPESSEAQTALKSKDKKKLDISVDSGNKSKLIETEDEIKEIFVSNAGLVLLNPFISRFFTSLDLIYEGKFQNQHDKIKSALILQFLVTGEKEIPEHTLPLNKLICGLDLSYPVPKEIDFTDKIIAESDKLLNSVIRHWKALKSTSVGGFRKSFLLRKGKLEIRGRDYLLNVESQSFDIILDTLPWGINIIKYDWMKKPLYVEWTL